MGCGGRGFSFGNLEIEGHNVEAVQAKRIERNAPYVLGEDMTGISASQEDDPPSDMGMTGQAHPVSNASNFHSITKKESERKKAMPKDLIQETGSTSIQSVFDHLFGEGKKPTTPEEWDLVILHEIKHGCVFDLSHNLSIIAAHGNPEREMPDWFHSAIIHKINTICTNCSRFDGAITIFHMLGLISQETIDSITTEEPLH